MNAARKHIPVSFNSQLSVPIQSSQAAAARYAGNRRPEIFRPFLRSCQREQRCVLAGTKTDHPLPDGDSCRGSGKNGRAGTDPASRLPEREFANQTAERLLVDEVAAAVEDVRSLLACRLWGSFGAGVGRRDDSGASQPLRGISLRAFSEWQRAVKEEVTNEA
ncbi:hypothetical protein SKAU_G00042010 [Synaphobranchus kaupii]|uniref:Uncharacterized protein n=1 Tax=Synaphobranchus kaupii TaxID=118154 RepID=A0A9Q1J7U4_SYNKA|nr:hypothetical protein SKAU_G00042010 [Synaphobranchus kaupii]